MSGTISCAADAARTVHAARRARLGLLCARTAARGAADRENAAATISDERWCECDNDGR